MGGGDSEGKEGSLEELQGFDFGRLAERRPDLKQELLGFRDHLLASSSTEESLKVPPLQPPHSSAHTNDVACDSCLDLGLTALVTLHVLSTQNRLHG